MTLHNLKRLIEIYFASHFKIGLPIYSYRQHSHNHTLNTKYNPSFHNKHFIGYLILAPYKGS
jgi:hypothetical protein